LNLSGDDEFSDAVIDAIISYFPESLALQKRYADMYCSYVVIFIETV